MAKRWPNKLSPDVQTNIFNAIRAGAYIETAAAYAGISKNTLYEWLREGRRQRSGVFRDFLDAIERAMADAEVRDLLNISEAAKDNWQASAWRLERKFPNRWGRRERLNAQVTHSGEVTEKREQTITYVHTIAEYKDAFDAVLSRSRTAVCDITSDDTRQSLHSPEADE